MRSPAIAVLVLVACDVPPTSPSATDDLSARDHADAGATITDLSSPARDLSGADAGGAPDLGATHHGVATWYDPAGLGACSFGLDPSASIAAMNMPQWSGSAVCGECLEVRGPNGTLTVMVADLCPECVPDQLDLSKSAFARIADPITGRIPIDWRPVPCAVTGPIRYRFKEGSSIWWTAIQVRNHRYAIQSLDWRRGTTAWQPIPREPYNYFVASAGVGTGSFQVRTVAITGQVLIDTLPAVTAGQIVDGAAQFP